MAEIYVTIVSLLETDDMRVDVTLPLLREVHVFDHKADGMCVMHIDPHEVKLFSRCHVIVG